MTDYLRRSLCYVHIYIVGYEWLDTMVTVCMIYSIFVMFILVVRSNLIYEYSYIEGTN